ncbi:MAG: ArsI/CadI family heavy metal resistance metalloenzyme [Myxococcota bacterium]
MRVHISLPVAAIDRSISFYEDLFGQAVSKQRDDYANFRLDVPGLMLALVQSSNRGDDAEGARHYGIELPDPETLAAFETRAKDAGLAVRVERQITCCYAVGDKFWATDPDGHAWEFWVRTADAESMGSGLPPAPAKPCCG